MAHFHPLDVTDVRHDTRDAVVVTLAPRPGDRAAFRFTQGQYLTFRRRFDGEEVRRAYSICSGRGEGVLRVAIKRVDGGCFSGWANTALKPGDVIEAMPPMGNFHAPIEPDRAKNYLFFAAGSGITPVLGNIRTVLAEEPRAGVTLVYANRSVASIMFREALEDLKNTHLGRLAILHILGGEGQDTDLFSGRIDRAKCDALFGHWIDVASTDIAFICGPEGLMVTVAEALKAHGLCDAQIRFELFASPRQSGTRRRAAPVQPGARDTGTTATIILDGTTRVVTMPKHGQSLLEAALAADLDAPFACKAGVCSTCRAMVLEGEVEMVANYALEDYEVRRGYVLTCQCTPLSDRITVSYDQ